MKAAGLRSPFFALLASASLPLWVWALYFFGSYAFLALACDQQWLEGVWLGMRTLRWVLLLAGGLTVALLLVLLARACSRTRQDTGRLAPKVRLASALLALVATVWTALPLLWLPSCHFTA
ncbi:hypothetical protein [Caldimonas brevitalea]|uniref:Uncharacterized protein n=1 Tax=Caldimonas brevitalea TaxID=413882 RepID=A0A0G3BRP3_9BURK|nr:hypothetical protein [Caldimonas brevitalea]AKJ30046.1 hypothetical protein AAW51_3355 [Caldimonas brevitalea]